MRLEMLHNSAIPTIKPDAVMSAPGLHCNRLRAALRLPMVGRTPHRHRCPSEPCLHWDRCGVDLLLHTSPLLADWHFTGPSLIQR